MKKKCIINLFFLSFGISVSNAQEMNSKKVLRRADSFFGLHFDFHATEHDDQLEITFSAETIDRMLTLIKPDCIQVDFKGHPGISI